MTHRGRRFASSRIHDLQPLTYRIQSALRIVSRQQLWALSILLLLLAARGGWCQNRGSGVSVPEGFQALLFADDDLAQDIYSLTIDSRGRVVVSGRGYVRILIDEDDDGRADRFVQYADGPRTGAQGMCFDGPDLLCTGDEGLIRYRDTDGDDRADGPPTLLLKLPTGSEHHSHAVRRGPDGWWYVMCGNKTGVDHTNVTGNRSPVRRPAAGTLLRIAPDFSSTEVIAHGFRNAYDFAFSEEGEIFVYDSDGEREVSLPWYRPTRVFHSFAGSHAGWFSRSWKRPDWFFDMPPELAEFGRGSPTGVLCYRHSQFPEIYRNAIFVADWTYGRIFALPLEPDGSTWKCEPRAFMSGAGDFGFAPTDLALGPDGTLFVSVGGRGTRGGVYRITYENHATAKNPPDESLDQLEACLTAEQPLSSWSRDGWQPLAEECGAESLRMAALDGNRPVAERVRAIEILTEMFSGLHPDEVHPLSTSKPVEVRCRAAWSLGRSTLSAGEVRKHLQPFLRDEDPRVLRTALESLHRFADEPLEKLTLALLHRGLAYPDSYVRQAASRVVARLDSQDVDRLKRELTSADQRGKLTLLLGQVNDSGSSQEEGLFFAVQVITDTTAPASLRLDAVRLAQLALGDVGPSGEMPAVFDGYHAREDHIKRFDSGALRSFARRTAEQFPSGDERLDRELSRLIAMFSLNDARLLDRVLNKIEARSHPSNDLHYLIIAAQIPCQRSAEQTKQIAEGLLALDAKFEARSLHRDSNYDPRVGELAEQLHQLDGNLAKALIETPDFGSPGHLNLVRQLDEQIWSQAIVSLADRIRRDTSYRWTNDVVLALANAGREEHMEFIRNQFHQFGLRGNIVIALAEQPREMDREKFFWGLESARLDVLSAAVEALHQLPRDTSAELQISLLRLMRRLGANPREFALRERVVRLLQRNLQSNHGFVFGRRGYEPQREVMQLWTRFLQEEYPQASWSVEMADPEEFASILSQLEKVNWQTSSRQRGAELFQSRGCHQCHGGRQALGPDLTGVTRRFSRNDLFRAIVSPNRDVSPRYQTTMIETVSGRFYTGLVIYESIDGLLLRDAANQTVRIESRDIQQRRTVPTSLMPAGYCAISAARIWRTSTATCRVSRRKDGDGSADTVVSNTVVSNTVVSIAVVSIAVAANAAVQVTC